MLTRNQLDAIRQSARSSDQFKVLTQAEQDRKSLLEVVDEALLLANAVYWGILNDARLPQDVLDAFRPFLPLVDPEE